jgi:adenine-specific DNA-methyltransferase
MATGISKGEQQSLDAISVLDIDVDGVPLPKANEKVRLCYSNKKDLADIITTKRRRYYSLSDGNAEEADQLLSNTFVLDDNIFALCELLRAGKKVDLYYLDPPYGTGFDFHSRSLQHAYKDSMSTSTYIEFMRRRLIIMRETMNESASIYVHIGHQMVGHLKVIMDEVFGADNFRNLITRRKCSSKNFTRKQFSNINDYILFYSKSRSYTWNKPGIEPDEQWIDKEYPKIDQFGRRYKLVPVHAPGIRNGETGLPWRGIMPPPGKHWQYSPSKLDELDQQGDIHWSRNGNPRRKVYWHSDKKMALTDYWDQYRDAHHQSIKITGYPTEKNFSMIKMIVGASSNEGDLVVDPFCGSGTTLHAARDLGRRYIGIDSSFAAAHATLRRLRHGIEKMGDYVSPKKAENQTISLLFNDYPHDQSCNFMVDKRIMEEYSSEVLKMARI